MTVQSKSKSTASSRLFVLDLDRCLLNDRIYSLFDEVVSESGLIDAQLFQEARREREASGGSFDSLGWLQEQDGFGENEHDRLLREYIRRAHKMKTDIFLPPEARSLLTALELHDVPHIIMTYGGRENQIAKIKAARLDSTTYMVVNRKHKAQYIAEWWNEMHGWFEVTVEDAVYRGESVVLVDDKAGAFDNLPVAPYARGYWLQTAQLLPSQQGSVPSNVTIIRNLEEIIKAEMLSAR